MTLTRRYRFSASHRLDLATLSAGENRRLYGKCNNPYGHGHDYVLDITVEGRPDESGQIMRRDTMDALVASRVLARLDHKDLNKDVPGLANDVPTTENLAHEIRRLLTEGWAFASKLKSVRIAETAKNSFELKI